MVDNSLRHWGILGMKWGVRRYQNRDGTLTSAGKRRYSRAEYGYGDPSYGFGSSASRAVKSARSSISSFVDRLLTPKLDLGGPWEADPRTKSGRSFLDKLWDKTLESRDRKGREEASRRIYDNFKDDYMNNSFFSPRENFNRLGRAMNNKANEFSQKNWTWGQAAQRRSYGLYDKFWPKKR